MFLSTSKILITKNFKDVNEGTHLISVYVNNNLLVKTHQLIVDDRIRPSRFNFIESEEEWKELLREIFQLWKQEKLEFGNKEIKELFFKECNYYLARSKD